MLDVAYPFQFMTYELWTTQKMHAFIQDYPCHSIVITMAGCRVTHEDVGTGIFILFWKRLQCKGKHHMDITRIC